MSVLSMPCLPDCTCGGQVVLKIDETGAWEVCLRCGSAHRPVPPPFTRTEARRLARIAHAKAVRGEL